MRFLIVLSIPCQHSCNVSANRGPFQHTQLVNPFPRQRFFNNNGKQCLLRATLEISSSQTLLLELRLSYLTANLGRVLDAFKGDN